MKPGEDHHIRFAIDVGGTFTDLIAWDSDTGEMRTNKASTTPDPSLGVLDVLGKEGLPLATAQLFIHGTTLGINAVLQKKGARTGLITTKGFRDVLEIARIDRPYMYDILYQKPPALVPRPLRLEADERMDARGNVLRPLNSEDVRRAAEIFKRKNVQAVAVCLLHSYANPTHEEQIGEILARELPGTYITLSHRILREYYEYERTMSAVMNCYTQPLMDSYLDGLNQRMEGKGFSGTFLLLRSSGGAMSYEEAREAPIFTLLSGPAGGVLGAAHLAELTGIGNLITADGGGTSFDVSLVVSKQPRITTETTVEGYKLLLPVLDIRSIGAGGGSIAWIDDGGALQVGPQSAGANPGPICYRRGGQQPTVTDAALCVGILNPVYFLGGDMPLDAEAAHNAIERIARSLGMDRDSVANGILTIAETKMAGAIREMTIEKGFDPRDFTLLAFGGSGPLFACNLGRRCELSRVLVPMAPANFSAWGMLMSDLVHDYSRTLVLDLDAIYPEQVESAFAELEAQAARALETDGVEPSRRHIFRSLDMRYFGQGGHSVTVPLEPGPFTADVRHELESVFHQLHEATYGHRTDDPVQIVHFRVRGRGAVEKPHIRKIAAGGKDASAAIKQQRQVFWRDLTGARPWPVYERSHLMAGNTFTGPAIVEEPTATTVVGPGDRAQVDTYGNLLIEVARL
jgi:N-methylhydantoinase A